MKKKYRDVLIPNDPFRRPEPNPEQVQLIQTEIQNIDCPDSYDDLMFEIRMILDKYIPERRKLGFYKKRFYDLPLPENILVEIREKHRLQMCFRANRSEINKQNRNRQRNLVTNLTREFKLIHRDNMLTG